MDSIFRPLLCKHAFFQPGNPISALATREVTRDSHAIFTTDPLVSVTQSRFTLRERTLISRAGSKTSLTEGTDR